MKWFYLRVLTVDKNYFDKYTCIEVLKSFLFLKVLIKRLTLSVNKDIFTTAN